MPMNDHSPEPKRTTTRKVYCMYEGLVEKQYFGYFNNRCDIKFSEIPRSPTDFLTSPDDISNNRKSNQNADNYYDYLEWKWRYTSNRWDMIQIAENYISRIKHNKYTTFGFVTESLNPLWIAIKKALYNKNEIFLSCLLESHNKSCYSDDKIDSLENFSNDSKFSDIRLSEAANQYSQIRKFIVMKIEEKYPDADFDSKETVQKINKYINGLSKVKNFLELHGQNKIEFKVRPVYPAKLLTFDCTRDKVFVVMDRDYRQSWEKLLNDNRNPDGTTIKETHSEEEYRELIRMCNEKQFDLLMSSPCFAIWLLMHHMDELPDDILECFDLTKKSIIHRKLNNKEKYLYSKEIPPGDEEAKSINDERLEFYFDNKSRAIGTSVRMKLSEADFISISKSDGCKVGSNVGIKLNDLKIIWSQ